MSYFYHLKIWPFFCQFKIWHPEESYSRFWHVVKKVLSEFLSQTRSKKLKAKTDMSEITLTKTSSFDFFQFKIWHALWTSLQLWHVVKRFASVFTTKKNLLFQNLYHWKFSNPKFDTFWTFRFKVWHVVRDGIQNLWHFLCSCYQNPNIFFSIHNLAKRKLFLPILTRCKQLFLKVWHVPKIWTQNLTVAKIHYENFTGRFFPI